MLRDHVEDGKPECPQPSTRKAGDEEFNKAQIAIIWYVACSTAGKGRTLASFICATMISRPVDYLHHMRVSNSERITGPHLRKLLLSAQNAIYVRSLGEVLEGIHITMPYSIASYMVRDFLREGSPTGTVNEELVGTLTGILVSSAMSIRHASGS